MKRVDPEGCGCTDCLTGYSVPVDLIPFAKLDDVVERLNNGQLDDATGMTERDWDTYLALCDSIRRVAEQAARGEVIYIGNFSNYRK